ncbi:MAG TPA: isochorismatase family protein [Steroidobacteraceae bacterium]
MQARLLIIDPQNDFCDIPGAALPVAGANADLTRLASFMRHVRAQLTDITVTLDSHASVGIERTTFWSTGTGDEVQPFTQITADDLAAGRFVPRDASRTADVLAYLRALEHGGRYRLVVWPVHCVLGTWGHNIHAGVATELARWEYAHQRSVDRVLKGLNPMTEQYSAVQAEVPLEQDATTRTNHALIARARAGDGPLLVAGEAASHCVAATVEHLFDAMSADERRRVIILRDCMSPVPGFEAQAEKFFAFALAQGARVTTTAELR